MPDLGMDDDDSNGGSKEMKIAVVTCAFDNSKIVNWLRERGDAIKDEHWDKLDTTELCYTTRISLIQACQNSTDSDTS